MENRYYYLDRDGRVHGPVWLSMMRELWSKGRLIFAKREVSVGGQLLKLTPIEYSLLGLLAQNAGRVITQKKILADIWGPNAIEEAQYLRVYESHLRKKLGECSVQIRNEPGIGYRLVTDPLASGSPA